MPLMQYDIAIVGGGMVGQAMALSMAKHDLNIIIIEPNQPNPSLHKSFHTRVSAITPKSETLLKNIAVWDLIQRKYAFTATKVWDQNSHGNLDFYAQDQHLDYLGHIVENDAIQQALFATLESTNVKLVQAKLENINKTQTGYQITLDNQLQIDCRLLVGADGANSRVRTLAEIDFKETNYQQHAIICNIQTEKNFENTIWQRFLSKSIVALLPLSATQASIVWSAENTLADELMSLTDSDFAQQLANSVECRFGKFEILSPRQTFPLIARSAKKYVQESLALVGDAAHNIHPLAGQGVNLGFADVRELSIHLLNNQQKLGDYLSLRKYARARRLDNELMAKTMTGLNWIYKENTEPLRWLRGFGMNTINNNPSLKSFFQQQAIN